MEQPKILYGICGIGSGHTQRQLPIITHLAKTCRIVVFAYGQSYTFYRDHFHKQDNVTVLMVSVPFYVGNGSGIDFALSHQRNAGQDHLSVNLQAMARAQALLGKPDLVITDYEPNAAQYAYATGAPLVTLDQQSKYLLGDFPEDLNGQSYRDEVALLSMFFPRADLRLACSFFKVLPRKGSDKTEEVEIVAPILAKTVMSMDRNPLYLDDSVLVYLSPQRQFSQSFKEIATIFSRQPDTYFHVFAPGVDGSEPAAKNVAFYRHGDHRFHLLLQQCKGMITTAGHTLLSEAMHLGIPVYAMPLAVYEQQMNAHVLHENGFGICHPVLAAEELSYYLGNIQAFAAAIKQDKTVLLRGSAENQIVSLLTSRFLSPSH